MLTLTNSHYTVNVQQNKPSSQQEDGYQTLTSCEKYTGDNVIREIRYGVAVYPLRNAINGFIEYVADVSKPYRFLVETFAPIYGVGETTDAARENWKYEFHQSFQNLSSKLYWERDDEEDALWNLMQDIVDIPKHRELTPLEFEQTGKIVVNDNIPTHQREIEWLDESRDIVECKDCPLELLQYETGQYFRASVRIYKAGKLQILAISQTNYRDYTDEEIEEFVNSCPTSKDLPKSIIWK
jgi:hypothetical protein